MGQILSKPFPFDSEIDSAAAVCPGLWLVAHPPQPFSHMIRGWLVGSPYNPITLYGCQPKNNGKTPKSSIKKHSWAVLSDEQMINGWPFSLLNDEQMSNKVRVEQQADRLFHELFSPSILRVLIPPLFLVQHPTFLVQQPRFWSNSVYCMKFLPGRCSAL